MSDRVCSQGGCGTILASFNPSSTCFLHTPDLVERQFQGKYVGRYTSKRSRGELAGRDRQDYRSGRWLGETAS